MAAKHRKPVPHEVKLQVLIESGYRCGNPTCREVLAIDLHHLEQVSEGGGNEPGNLLPLCPTHHAHYHRKVFDQTALFAWKGTLVALSHAFDGEAIDLLLFLKRPEGADLVVDPNGALRFARLVVAGLVTLRRDARGGSTYSSTTLPWYEVRLTLKGSAFIEAWIQGDREAVKLAMSAGESV